MLEVTEPKIVLSILDFGMGGQITREMQASILLLGAGIELNRADLLTEALWKLAEPGKSEISRQELTSKVEARLAAIKNGRLPFQTLDQWSAWAINEGVRFPYSFVSMNRGLVILDRSLKDAGSDRSMTSIAKGMTPFHIQSILKDLRAGGLLSWNDISRLGWVVATKQNRTQSPERVVAPMRCERLYL